MGKIILILAVLITACENKPFTGYIVGKEYEAGHMCHDEYRHTIQSSFFIAPHIRTVPHVHHHTYEKPKFTLHIANSYELRHINVDTFMFVRTKILDKITIN